MGNPYEGWAIVELAHGEPLAGYYTKQVLGGLALASIEIPRSDGRKPIRFYEPVDAIRRVTPTTPRKAEAFVARMWPTLVALEF